jgi:hypothetical protein
MLQAPYEFFPCKTVKHATDPELLSSSVEMLQAPEENMHLVGWVQDGWGSFIRRALSAAARQAQKPAPMSAATGAGGACAGATDADPIGTARCSPYHGFCPHQPHIDRAMPKQTQSKPGSVV